MFIIVGAGIARPPNIFKNIGIFQENHLLIAVGDVILQGKITGRPMVAPTVLYDRQPEKQEFVLACYQKKQRRCRCFSLSFLSR